MAFDFILMLTMADRTVPDAAARLDEALEGGVRHIGFKDIGLPFEALRGLADTIRAAGGRSYLEVVSLDETSEMASARAAVALDVDCLLGGTRAEAVTEITRDHPVRYYPFPGQIVGHPSVLAGSVGEIAESARRLADLEHVHGLDLLAYRFNGDVPALVSSICAAVSKPVVVAGSIDTAERITAVAGAGAAGFTVGTAAFDGAFDAGEPGFAAQVRAILALAESAARRATARRRIALVAHEGRKPHLLAWTRRHAPVLARHRLICTGGTGAMISAALPSLPLRRLQRGARGGDQQLGAMMATGELDAVVFFADPSAALGGDVDLAALTRLAIVHDVPVALSASAADLMVQALPGR